MKKLYSVATLAFFAVSALMAQSPELKNQEIDATVTVKRTGREMLASIRQSYESGAYDAFLANLHADYLTFVKSGKFAEFVKMRDIPQADEQLLQLSARWDELNQKLIDDRNGELKAVCDGQSDSVISQRVRSVLEQLSPEQKEALHYLASLRFKTPDKAVNDDEKKLIEIDLATEFNIVHLDAQYAQKPFVDRLDKHILINMDMIRQMKDAANDFTDAHLKKQVEIAADIFDVWQARNWDMNELYRQVKKPSTDIEKKIASVLLNYKAKKEDLYQKEFLAQIGK